MISLAPALKRLVANRAAAGPRRPDRSRELTAPPSLAWNVRTVILPLAGEGRPVRLLFLNLICGPVGIAGFDDCPPGAEWLLPVVMVGPQLDRRRTFEFVPGRGNGFAGDSYRLDSPGFRYEVGGSWPTYRLGLQVEPWDLMVDLNVGCEEPLVWWSNANPLYSHYSAFGRAVGTLELAGQRHPIDDRISLEHGLGGNLQGLPWKPIVPVTQFHYQLGSFESGESFALGCFSSMGLEFFRRGVLLDADGTQHRLDDWSIDRSRWTEIPDRCGGGIEVPTDFRLQARGPDVALSYNATGFHPPHAGNGRLTSTGAAIEGSLQFAGTSFRSVRGSLYIEHLTGP